MRDSMGKPVRWILANRILATFCLTILTELHRLLYDRLCPLLRGTAVGCWCIRMFLGHNGYSGLGQTWAVHDMGIEHLQEQVIQRHNLLHFHAVQVVHTFVAAGSDKNNKKINKRYWRPDWLLCRKSRRQKEINWRIFWLTF